jgi:hypothetical protein
VKLYINVNWVFPDVWNSLSLPQGITPLDPVLYAGSNGSLVSANAINPATGLPYGCGSAYPIGGYDC